MSKRRKKNRRDKRPIPQATKRRFPDVTVLFLALAILISLGIWRWSWFKPEDASTPGTLPNEANAPNSTVTNSNAEFRKLKGRWQRPDGGYIVEVKSVAPDGSIDAAYFNPELIHVTRAEASRDGDAIKVSIELRDVNYPGSTYTLTYEPRSDELKGIYYQAIERQRFEVAFVRLK